MTSRFVLLTMTLAMIAGAPRAMAQQAGTFTFTYTYAPGESFGAELTGTLAADDNTFTATGYDAFYADGSLVTLASPVVASASTYTGTATLTLDGSLLNFVAGDDTLANFIYLQVSNGTGYAQSSGALFPTDFVNFDASDYTAGFTPNGASPLPEPASLGAFLAGLTVVGYARRRRAM